MQRLAADLDRKLQGRASARPCECNAYGLDASMFRVTPVMITEPASAEDVVCILETARRNGLSVTPRGAGTGLAGESLNNGIIMDLSVRMNRVRRFLPHEPFIELGPGAVRDRVNQYTASHGLQIGPDPATGSRCTVGGMAANNSTGAHSLLYGMTADWVDYLDVVFADGETARVSPLEDSASSLRRLSLSHPRYHAIVTTLKQLRDDHADVVDGAYPTVRRNRHGYNLRDIQGRGMITLIPLLCGSEGTLAVITGVGLRLNLVPRCQGLCLFAFSDRLRAAAAVPRVLTTSPAAVEIIDRRCLELARSRPEYARLLPDEADAVLLVEWSGDDPGEIERRQSMAERELDGLLCGHFRPADAAEAGHLWGVRKAVAGLMTRLPGRKQPVPLLEDAAVPPERLPEFMRAVDAVLSRENLDYLFFGHAGDGVVHVRPIIDRGDTALMRRLPAVCREVYGAALSVGGSISGEHGDGMLRAPFLEQQYGQEMVGLFREVKRLFDPSTLLNPGKKPDLDHCRDWTTRNRYAGKISSRWGRRDAFARTPEQLYEMMQRCNGCGACRGLEDDTRMCPVFRVVRIEAAAPRAKVAALLALMEGRLSVKDAAEPAEYCLQCGMCAAECPAGVNAGEAVLYLRYFRRPLSLAHAIWNRFERAVYYGGGAPGLSNAAATLPLSRFMARWLAGISEKRPLPRFHHRPVFRGMGGNAADGLEAVLYVESFTATLFPDVVRAVQTLLDECDTRYTVYQAPTAGVVPLGLGSFQQARRQVKSNLKRLRPLMERGALVVCVEPTSAHMLREALPLLTGGEAPEAVVNLGVFLSSRVRVSQTFRRRVAYHAPCHLKRYGEDRMTFEVLSQVCEPAPIALNAGCCGMAGTYGMKAAHYRLSMKMGRGLFRAAVDSGCSVVATDCSTCRLQLAHGLPGMTVRHPAELLTASVTE